MGVCLHVNHGPPEPGPNRWAAKVRVIGGNVRVRCGEPVNQCYWHGNWGSSVEA